MTWLNAQFSVDDAIQRQLDVWELLVDEWGNVSSQSADGSSLSFPPQGLRALPTPAAIAIGPRSTIDRCWIVYSLQKLVPSLSLWDFARRVSVGVPLCFSQPADQLLAQTKIDVGTGSMTILPFRSLAGYTAAQGSYDSNPIDNTRFRNAYKKTDGTAGTFGPTNPTAYWMSPLLHLYIYLRPPMIVPAKRLPLNVAFEKGAVNGAEVLIGMIPVAGRKTINVTVRCNVPGGTADCRLALIQQLSDSNATPMSESTAAAQAAIVNGVTFRFPAVTNANSDYLMIYMTPNAQPGSLIVYVTATDD